MEINGKQLKAKSVSMQIIIDHGALNLDWSDWFLHPTYFQI